MTRKSNWMVKGTPDLKKKLDETRIERIKNGLDKEMKSYSDLLDASARFAPLWDILKKAELKTDITKEKKKKGFIDDDVGQFITFNIFTFIVTAFLVAVFFAGLIYVMGLVNNVFITVGVANEANIGNAGYTNMSLAAEQTFGVLNNSIQSLRMVAFVYILGLAITIILTSALVRMHPIFFFAYLLIVILAVIFAAPISNAYLTLLNSNIFEGTLGSFTASNWILKRLPLLTLTVGVLGAVFIFINMVRGEGSQMR